ncbi:unnamed protein product [Linum trigynum]|uniref:Uncharacterized protein n=1 Tax=Linum trigynum TaxID=586398 RepID=A0AAV2DTL8_9ROSI
MIGNYLQKHPNCEGLNKKPFMVYDALTPVFCKGRASGDHGVDTNDPICLDETSGEDEEIPNIADIDANERIFEEINAELAYEKRQPASMSPKKKRKKGMTVEERLTDATGEMRDLRPLIKQSMDTLARALGESDDHISMRDNLFESLEQLGRLDREGIIAAVIVLSMNDRHLMMFYKIQNVLDKLMFVKRLIG